jgi:hypothetical protein
MPDNNWYFCNAIIIIIIIIINARQKLVFL